MYLLNAIALQAECDQWLMSDARKKNVMGMIEIMKVLFPIGIECIATIWPANAFKKNTVVKKCMDKDIVTTYATFFLVELTISQ